MEKKKLAFFDNTYHSVTGSAEFFKDLLRSQYEITVFFRESWQGEAPGWKQVKGENFDVMIFWQSLPALRQISGLTCLNLIWVPMCDEEPDRADVYWRILATLGLKVISFSQTIHRIAKRFGLDSFYIQFFPEPPAESVAYATRRVFLWQRRSAFGWPLLKRLLTGNAVAAVTLRNNPDPGHLFDEPSSDDRHDFSIEIVKDPALLSTSSNEAYVRLISQSNIFMAPRPLEGIGMSFLEAMAMGMCIIAPNAPTMNEYISSGENGFLFDARDPKPIDLGEFERCGRSARAFIAEGHRRWQAAIPNLLEFICMTQTKRSEKSRAVCLAWDFAYTLRKRAAKLGLSARILPKREAGK